MSDAPRPGGEDLPALARHLFRTAGGLRGLAEVIDGGTWHPDGMAAAVADLGRVADTLNRMAVVTAIGSGDADAISDVTGRTFVQTDPTDPTTPGDPGEAGGEGGGEGGADDWRYGLTQWRPADSPWTGDQWIRETRGLRSALEALSIQVPHCLPGEPGDCGEPVWSHYATYAAMLRAYSQGMAEENLGPGSPGALFAEHVYQAELDFFRGQAEQVRLADDPDDPDGRDEGRDGGRDPA